MAPMGSKGRGLERGHYEPSHLCNLILAFAGTEPSDSADAVRLLRPLRYACSEGDELLDLQNQHLGETVERLIDAFHNPEGLKASQEIAASDFEFTFCLSPVFAKVVMVEEGKTQTVFFLPAETPELFAVPTRLTSRVRRLTTIGFDTLKVAGDLWRDTLAHRVKPSERVVPGSTVVSKTASPGRKAALHDQPATTELDGSQQLDPTCEREKSQSSPSSQAGHLTSDRSALDDEIGNGGASRAAT